MKNNYNTVQKFRNEEAYMMKACMKALVVAGLCVSMALGMVGCGREPMDGSQVVATVGEKEMTLGEANFLLRYQQVQTESYYESLLGITSLYEQDLYGRGTSYGYEFKNEVMGQLQEYYIVEEKASITEAAAAFLAANDDYVKEQMTADQATVERVLTLMTIRSKVAAAVKAEADVTVTDEEAAQRGFSYITISKGSEDTALTEEEVQSYKEKLAAVAESVKAGNAMDGAAVEQGMTAYAGTYGEGTDVYYAEDMIAALNGIKEGEVTEIIETESELYLATVTAELDEEATANRKETLISTAQTEYYNSLLETWMAEYEVTVNENVWEQVVFDRSYDPAS